MIPRFILTPALIGFFLLIPAKDTTLGAYTTVEQLIDHLKNGGDTRDVAISVGDFIKALQQVSQNNPAPEIGETRPPIQFINCVFEDQNPKSADPKSTPPDVPLHLNQTLKFANCRFEELAIPDLACGADLIFDDCHFGGKLSLRYLTSTGTTKFDNCQFIDSCQIAIGSPSDGKAGIRDLLVSNCSFSRSFYLMTTIQTPLQFTNNNFNEDFRIDKEALLSSNKKTNNPEEANTAFARLNIGESTFEACVFHGPFLASNVTFSESTRFSYCDFGGLTSFEDDVVLEMEFLDCQFHQDACFGGISGKGGVLAFSGETTFFGVSKFDRFSADKLEFDDGPSSAVPTSKHFCTYTSFKDLQTSHFSIEDGIFDGYVEISGYPPDCSFVLSDCQMNGDINFLSDREGAKDCTLEGLAMTKCKFAKGAFVSHGQVFRPEIFAAIDRPALWGQIDAESLSAISTAADRADELSFSDDVIYYNHVKKNKSLSLLEILNGYGARPSRLIGWLLILICIWSIIYFQEVRRQFSSRPAGWQWRQSFIFSTKCALFPHYGWQNSTTWFYRVVCTAEFLFGISMATSFLISELKPYPLVQQIASKIIPF